jgi:mannose/fructose/N-acetylgalactosamine-specific phosphotransferase system component IID
MLQLLKKDSCEDWGTTGSVLGPLLFLIYINDIDNSVKGNILKFAGDTKIFSLVVDLEDIQRLQKDLRTLCKWSDY